MNGCLYREERAIIPTSLRSRILQLAHEGHPGIVRTKHRLRESVWWPNIDRDAEQFVRSCESCIMADKACKPITPPIKPVPYPTRPWEKLSIDIIGELHGCPSTHRFVIVLLDLHSKWPEIKPVSTITSSAVISFLSDMFTRWGLPREIISDNGKQFTSREFEDFLSGLGIQHCKTALYHPQANGAVERFNRVLKEGLRGGKYSKRPIDVTLRSVLSSYRSLPHSTTGVSPAELMIGRQLRTPLDLLSLSHTPRKVHFDDASLQEHVSEKQNQYKSYGDHRRHARDSHFQAGDQVRVRDPIRASKLDPAYSEPKTVISKPSPDTARLDDGTTWNSRSLLPVPDSFSIPEVVQPEHPHPTSPMKTGSTKKPSSPMKSAEPPIVQAEPEAVAQASPPPLRHSTRPHQPPARFADYVYTQHRRY